MNNPVAQPVEAVADAVEKVEETVVDIAKQAESAVEYATVDAFRALTATVETIGTSIKDLQQQILDLGTKVESGTAAAADKPIEEVEKAEPAPNPVVEKKSDTLLGKFHEFAG